jgi:ribulose-5-phosphate 4-epimerase/fuculose-1-phosphate aldolase
MAATSAAIRPRRSCSCTAPCTRCAGPRAPSWKIGRLPLIPYYRPGDPKLGEAIRGYAAKSHAVLLANHGPVVAGNSLEDAVYATEELEETAKLYLLLHGRNPRCLTEAQIAELRETFSLS